MNPLKIGNVVRVQSGRIEVMLTVPDLDLEHEGRGYRVGQLGSYVTLPADGVTLIGFVTACGRQEVTVVDIEPQIIMEVQLLGEIRGDKFRRGVNESPIVGDDVWVAVHDDFETIFGSFDQLLAGNAQAKSFTLGRFAMNTEFEVKVLGSEFFNKNVAVLGNSGSGKSCTTAKIMQEVIRLPQSRVVLFDIHGEYRSAFSNDDGRMDDNVLYLGSEDLVLPYWLLRYEELETILVDRSNPLHVNSQISFLRTALLEFKQDAANELGLSQHLTIDTPIYFNLECLRTYAENLNEARYVLNSEHLAFNRLALRSMPPAEQQALMRRQRCQFNKGNPEGETTHRVYFGKLVGLIDRLNTYMLDPRYEFLFRPVEHATQSEPFRQQLSAENTAGQMSAVMAHLIRLLTGRTEPKHNLVIIDLSGIPHDIVDITVAVITRLLFDVNFWTPSNQRHPLLLVYEEAHKYIPRRRTEHDFARRAVERVAKEGRKYGVTGMVISQRPSELSETVLAQCANLVVMRLNNPEDQDYVARVVSDHFTSLIDMLPIMRPGEGFVIGDSVLMPMRTLIELPDRQPRSADVDFFQLWSSAAPPCDVETVLDHWWRQDRQALNRLPNKAASPEQAPEKPVSRVSPTMSPPISSLSI
ncbi:MAG: ATP-binding protein [Planctomycetes bacterium]|nr:ATP-binding protein [Planctomycetota bacterium]